MRHLAKDIYVDSDGDYSFTLHRKKITEKGTRFVILGYFPNPERVSKKLTDLGVKEFIDKDWLQCVEFVNESHANFIETLKKSK